MKEFFEMHEEKVGRVIKVVTLLLISGSLYLLAQSAVALKEWAYVGRDVPAQTTITVSGNGEVFAVPDVAEFSFSVVKEAKTVPEAQKLSAELSNAIFAYLKGAGIEEKDIKTINYTVNPKYEWQNFLIPSLEKEQKIVCVRAPCPSYPPNFPEKKNVLVGYEVSQTLSVKVRKVNDAGTLLSGVGEKGATNISGLQFTIDNPDALRREARQKAIVEAKTKANELAKDLGVRLVRIISFNESGFPGPIFYGKAMGMEMAAPAGMGGDAVAPNVAPGENTISSSVNITYEIK